LEKKMTEVTETPAAPAEGGTPAASAESQPAAPAVKPTQEPASLVESGDPNAAPAETPAPEAPAAAPETPTEPTWFLADGVPGEGDAPEWFRADKYKSLDQQAKAYVELEKRLGAFEGAPEDGTYKINVPEGIPLEFDTEHPLFQELNNWARESQLSQKGYDQIIGMFANYEAAMQPDMGELKKQVGENADARINSVNQWAKSNLSEEEYKSFRNAQTMANAPDVFKAMEAVIAKTREVSLPGPDDDVSGATKTTLEEINEMQAKRDESGQRLYEKDPAYREMVEKKRRDYFASLPSSGQMR
jgi:hypothetical protein